jgi:hypothetical protein
MIYLTTVWMLKVHGLKCHWQIGGPRAVRSDPTHKRVALIVSEYTHVFLWYTHASVTCRWQHTSVEVETSFVPKSYL